MIGDMTEQKLIEWANSRIDKEYNITNFKDKKLASSQFFFQTFSFN